MTRKRPARPFKNINRDGGKMVESIRRYDPDQDFAPKNEKSLILRFVEALTAKPKDAKKALPDLVESARIISVNRFGAYKVETIKGSDEFRAALERAKTGEKAIRKVIENGIKLRPIGEFKAKECAKFREMAATKKFREDFDIADNTNTGGTGNPFDEYIPIMGGPFFHQLYLHDMLDALAKSFEAWNHNPLAHQIVKITTQFVLGRGVAPKARDPLVHERFLQWWDKNDMSGRLEYWSDMLGRDGELMIRKFVNPITKEMFVRWLDPSTIWEIVTDLEDIERVFYYHQQYPTQYQVLYGAPKGSGFDPTKFESSKYVINQIPAGEVCHVKINCSPNEKRGRSDLFPILGWLKRYKDFQTAVVLRAIIQSTFAWKNKLSGTNADVEAFISEFGTDTPEFGSVWVENEASTLEPMTADVGSGKATADCPGVVNAIAVGAGIPKEWLGMGDASTRATAVVASEPGVKKFQARQLQIGRLLKDIAQAWFANEVAAGRIPKFQSKAGTDPKQPADLADSVRRKLTSMPEPKALVATDGMIEFQFPEIAIEDRTAKMRDIDSARNSGYLSKKRAASMSAKELGVEDYSYEAEQEEIAEEGAADMSALYNPLGLQPNAPPAAPVQPPAAPGAEPQKPNPTDPKPNDPKPGEPEEKPNSGGLSGEERRDIKQQNSR